MEQVRAREQDLERERREVEKLRKEREELLQDGSDAGLAEVEAREAIEIQSLITKNVELREALGRLESEQLRDTQRAMSELQKERQELAAARRQVEAKMAELETMSEELGQGAEVVDAVSRRGRARSRSRSRSQSASQPGSGGTRTDRVCEFLR